jgi:hypothetical protein
MESPTTALDTSLLPQYQMSAAFMERFLIAAHVEGDSIERSQNNEIFKLVDSCELEIDMLKYFTENKEAFRKEFANELESKLPDGVFKLFCEVLAEEWLDGKSKRLDGRCRRLKRSIYDYLRLLVGNETQFVQAEDLSEDLEPLIAAEDIGMILMVNDQMIYRHIEEWKQSHPNSDSISDSDIFLRRGLALKSKFNTEDLYRERYFINSYSIAFSAPEKFSQIGKKIPALVNGDISLFASRVLFFSPFIPGMDASQLEFGIIPSEKPLPIHYQGSHGGIDEYIIDPAPFQK